MRGVRGRAAAVMLAAFFAGGAWAQTPAPTLSSLVVADPHGKVLSTGTGSTIIVSGITFPYVFVTATASDADATIILQVTSTLSIPLPSGVAVKVRFIRGVRTRVVRVSKSGATRDYTLVLIRHGDGHSDDPTSFRATADRGSIDLAWDPPTDTNGTDIIGYKVRWKTADASATYSNTGGKAGADIPGGASARTHTIPELTAGTTYEVQVAAANTFGTGGWADSQRAVPREVIPPLAATDLAAAWGDGVLTLSWTAPADDGGKAITGYRYRWSNDNDDSDWEHTPSSGRAAEDGLDIPNSANAAEYILSSLTNGVNYQVQIAAVNALGVGQWTASAAGRPLAAPGVPRQLQAAATDGALLAMWMPPADGGGAADGELTYSVRWRAAADANYDSDDAAETAGGAVSYRIASLTNGTTYAVQVRAQFTGGMSDWSAEAQGAPVAFHIDLDADSDADWIDGVVVTRYLLGLRGADLIANLSGLDADDATRITAHLDANRGALDVDASGAVTPADGILIARHLMDVTDNAELLDGQTAATDADAVKAAIDALKP